MKQLGFITILLLMAYSSSAQSDTAKKEQTERPPTIDRLEVAKASKIDLADVSTNLNQYVELHGKVYDHKGFDSYVLLNLGGKVTVILNGNAFLYFSVDKIDGKEVWVRGLILPYLEKPEITVSELGDIKLMP